MDHPGGDLSLAAARLEDRPALENLLQLYTHDFSEHWAGGARGELGADGRFERYPLDAYWQREHHEPLFIRVGRHLAGFVLINRETHSGQPADFNLAELFVVRKHRRAGQGRRAVHQVLGQRPGIWEVAVARKNTAALSFWRAALASLPGASPVAQQDQQDPRWDGPILRLTVSPFTK